jgi:hypothetical protein
LPFSASISDVNIAISTFSGSYSSILRFMKTDRESNRMSISIAHV